jgi:arylsulfatase
VKKGYGLARAAFTVFVWALLPLLATTAQAQSQKPNILVIWGDDIGVGNISAYNHGIMLKQ